MREEVLYVIFLDLTKAYDALDRSRTLKKLRRNRAGGPSGIRAEDIKGWLAAARRGGLAEEKGEERTAAEAEGGEMWEKSLK